MQALIYINRQVVARNKKLTKEAGEIVDEPAIAVHTYLGSIYCKHIEFTIEGARLLQDACHARCSGATIWMEADFESLIIDGVKANRAMFLKTVRSSH